MLRSACITFFAVVLVPASVQAFDHHHHSSHHSSSSDGGGGCGSHDDDSHASSTHSTPTSSPSPSPSTTTTRKRVFVTTTTYAGALGGLDSADGFCQSAATEHGLTGHYRAWLSSGTTDAYDRVIGDGPWVNTKGVQVFASKAALREAASADILDESGEAPANLGTTGAWSGSDQAGAHSGTDCAGWTDGTDGATASMGSALAEDPSWGGGDAPAACSAKAPLICFED